MAEASENNVAYALVLFETACYTLNWLLGESSICGWITAAMAIIVLYLETLPEGVARLQALTTIQLELGLLFIILGATGLSKKLNTLMPTALKGGIVLGAGINSVAARLKEGGAVDTATIGCLVGLTVVCLFMFSQRIREHMATNKLLSLLGNCSFLWAVLILFVVGGLTGDFITVQELGFAAFREDEHIEFDANRTNVICGIRNVILSLCAPYPALAGPLSPPYCIATYARYHQGGREAMASIYDGSATNLLFAVLSLFLYALYEGSLAASGTLLVAILLIQGFVCAQIDCNMLRDDMDKGLAGMGAGLVVARGAAVALPASIILYLLLCNNKKIKEDYRLNKEIQSQEDEETERQLAILEARMRGGKAEDGMPVEPMKKE